MQNLTPGAKKLAREKGISLESVTIKGTGFRGAVSEKDFLNYLEAGNSPGTRAVTGAGGTKDSGVPGKNRAIATPLARKMADAAGISLAEMAKPAGKITAADVRNVTAMKPGPSAAAETDESKVILEKVPYTGVRKIIGDRLSQSKLTAPHLYFTQKVNMEELLKMRKSFNEQKNIKISVTDYIAKAVIQTLQQYPGVNASLADGFIEKYRSVNLGIAVAAASGLIVPVIKHSERLSIMEINRYSSELIEKARNGKLSRDEYRGGTFTVSNLGMVGIENFTAVINPPESAILSISATLDEPAVIQGSGGIKTIAIKPMMNICLSVDHRVIDGMLAAQFVTEVKNKLERPFGLLVD